MHQSKPKHLLTCANHPMACLHHRMGASMHDRSYFCIARLLVVNTGEDTELEERSSGRGGQQHDSRLSQQARLVTVTILHAVCGCKSGLSGNCHHLQTLLQLVRVLSRSDFEWTQREALTCTGAVCTWLWDHQRGGKEHSIFWGQRLGDIPSLVGGAKNPRNQPRGFSGSVRSESGGSKGKKDGTRRTRTVRNRPSEYKKTYDSRTGSTAGLLSPREFSFFCELMTDIRLAAKANMEKGGRRSGQTTVRAQDMLPPRPSTM